MNKKDGLLLGENITGVNQILPHKHPFAWDLFQKGVNAFNNLAESPSIKSKQAATKIQRTAYCQLPSRA